jgi:hypothetical protein
MPNETETRTGVCATHGSVEGTRIVPRVTFPWLVNSIRRKMAERRPFRCPTCDEPVETH